MHQEDDLHFLLNDFIDRQTAFRRKGESLLFSLIFHFLFVLLIIFGPHLRFLWQKPPDLPAQELTRLESHQPVFAPIPNDQRHPRRTPNPPAHDRRPVDKAPMVNPLKQSLSNSAEELKIPSPPTPREIIKPTADAAQPPPSTSNQEQHGLTQEEGKISEKLSLPEEMNRNGKRGTNFRDLMEKMESPGNSLQSSIDEAIHKGLFRSGSASGEAGGGIHKFDKRQANFSVDEPTILSNTQGVDFGAWLRIIYFRVRDNWYAAIPELIRTGTRGKTVLVFDVLKDGRILNLQVAKTSGLLPYDRAAISSINLSVPFPNFPPAFSGDYLTIQFSYFYNIHL
jgi:hypothetical protein